MWWTEDEGPGQLYSFLEIKLKYPDAVIAGHGVSVPPGHPNQVIGVDGIRFDNMRTNMGATVPDQPRGGWPVEPIPEADNVAVAAGGTHTCSVKVDGRVHCWGQNSHGELGDGTRSERRRGEPVVGIDDAVAVAVGSRHSCALSESGGVSCWGRNSVGQLGSGLPIDDSATPVQVVGLESGVTGIDAHADVTCAALENGTARCWGNNQRGQLGNGESGAGLYIDVPIEVSGLSSVAEVAAGSCARTTTGAVYCWGAGTHGRIGDGTGDDSAVPVAVTGLGEAATSITTSSRLTCATTASGAHCWGANGHMGFDSGVPVPVDGLHGSVSVDTFNVSACALTGAGGVMCWGADYDGQLGDGQPREASAVPVPVTGLQTGVDSLSVGSSHACAVAEGLVWCWGDNLWYQSGHSKGPSFSVPVIAQA